MRVFLLIALAGSGVVAQTVDVVFDKAIDFRKFTSFCFSESNPDSKNPSLNKDSIKKRVKDDIQNALEAKGRVFVQNGEPSLKLVYSLESATKTKVESSRVGAHAEKQSVTKMPYTEATLIIGLRTPQSLVWRSVVRVDSENIEAKLDEMVQKSIDKYPPKEF